MSLRARIEAVIYAAEEPVTLAQLSALFAAEALEERAARLGQAQDGLSQTSSPALLKSAPAKETAEHAADEHAEQPASDAAIEQAVEHPEQVSITQPDGFAPELESQERPASPPNTDEADARRLTRQRERDARDEIRRALDELIAAYDQGDRGMEIREIAGGYRVATKPEYHDAVRSFVKSLKPPMKLSLQALETLAVIAYKQPVTAPEVSDIRGVDSGGVLGSLISRKLVTTAGRKQVIGRPILYKTTKEFLLRFGLKDLAELPSMEEFEKMAGELVEPETPAQMDLSAPPTPAGDTTMQSMEPEETDLPTKFEESIVASDEPEPGDQEDEELRASARANVKIDDETVAAYDLPGVTGDTAGKVNIDSRTHSPIVFDEDVY